MLSIEEAQARIWRYAAPGTVVSLPLDAALGLVLAEDVVSGEDLPPYDKSLVDGYAVAVNGLRSGCAELAVVETIAAGHVPRQRVEPGTASRIMTGAPVPDGANAVVMVERTELVGDRPDRVVVRDPAVHEDQHIMRRGTVRRAGAAVLAAGRRLRPVEIGLLAEQGHAAARVYARPVVSVLATGDELVPPEGVPGPGRIRNSNGPMLCSLVQRAGGVARDLGIGRDEAADLQRLIRLGLESDVLILSGGVSAGLFDLVPQALTDAGVEPVFHKVSLKPGKPLWFGVGSAEDRRRLVFGLPGNPVSTLVCFELFVRPTLARLAGDTAAVPTHRVATLARAHFHQSDRTTYFPATCHFREGEAYVEATAWKGSSDLATLAAANCLLHLPAGKRQYAEGERVALLELD